MKLLRINFCVRSWSTTFIHSWWLVPFDQKESELDYVAIDVIFTQDTNFGSKNRLEMVLQCYESVISCVLDHRFLLMKKSPILKSMRMTWFSHYKLMLGREIDWKWFQNDPTQCFPAFLIIGSSWRKRVRNWKWYDRPDFRSIN